MDIIAEKEIEHHTQDNEENCTIDAHTSYHPLNQALPTDDIGPGETLQEIGALFSFRQWLDERRENELSVSQVNNSGVDGPNETERADRAKARVKRSRYLPCHYFDYIGGTSTGG